MAGVTDRPDKVPGNVASFLRQLGVTYKAARLYPPKSDIPSRRAETLHGLLGEALTGSAEIRFEVTKDGLLSDGRPVIRCLDPGVVRTDVDEYM